jgi:hypothetical protein
VASTRAISVRSSFLTKRERYWRTRKDRFEEVWPEIAEQLQGNPGLEAKTIFAELQRKFAELLHLLRNSLLCHDAGDSVPSLRWPRPIARLRSMLSRILSLPVSTIAYPLPLGPSAA